MSELDDLLKLTGGTVTVNAKGELLGANGEVVTIPDTPQPLKDRYKDQQALLDDVAQKNYRQKIKIDGTLMPWSQFYADPPAFFGSEPGTGDLLALEVPASTVPVVTIPPPSAVQFVTIQPPASGQGITKISGPCIINLPGQKPGIDKFFRAARQIGADNPGGDIVVKDTAGNVLFKESAVTMVTYSINQPAPRPVSFSAAVDELVVELVDVTGPIIFDYHSGK